MTRTAQETEAPNTTRSESTGQEDTAALERTIRRIFSEELELEVDNDTEVVSSGMLDSLAFVKLLVGLEREFGIKVDLAALDLEDFGTVERIARLVATKRNGAS